MTTAGLQILENRAVRAVVALAVVHQLLEGVAQAAEFANFAFQFGDMGSGQGFHIGTGALAVLPQGQ